MAKKKVYLVPTIGTFETYRDLFDPEKKRTEADLKGLKDFVIKSEEIVKKAIDKGVMVVNGADMYIFTEKPQGVAAKNSMEAYYVGCGKANEVLKTATKNAAIACGVSDRVGAVKENMRADIVAFDGDLEKNFVTSLYKVKFVMKNGEIIPPVNK
jgi:imidazolonepropionase-like amidohydrolase